MPAEGKPETLLVLNEDNAKYFRVLVLIESIANGNPLEYLICADGLARGLGSQWSRTLMP